jgi:hypothetical protein
MKHRWGKPQRHGDTEERYRDEGDKGVTRISPVYENILDRINRISGIQKAG